MARLQTCEIDLAGFGELPDELTRFASFNGDSVGIGMLHLGKFLGKCGMLLQFLERTELK